MVRLYEGKHEQCAPVDGLRANRDIKKKDRHVLLEDTGSLAKPGWRDFTEHLRYLVETSKSLYLTFMSKDHTLEQGP